MSSDTTLRHMKIMRTTALVCLALAVLAGCSGRRSQQQTEIGETFLSIGNVAEARQAFEKALELNPENIEAELGLARCLATQDNLDAALEHYRKVIDHDPARETAYVEAVRILLRRERNEEANQLAAAYESVDPIKGGILHAFVLRTSGMTAEAVALLEDLAKQFPESADLRVSLANAHMASGQDAKAVEILEDVLANLDPDSLSARMRLVEVYQRQGKIDEIVAQFREMVRQNPNDLGLQLALARSLVDKKEYSEAEDIARTILRELPESGWANYVVGACLLARGDYEKAVMYLQTAVQALPDFEIAREQLALARRGGTPETATATETAPASPGETEAPSVPATPDSLSWQVLWQQARFDALLEQSGELLESSDEPALRETLVAAALFSNDLTRAQQLAENLPADAPLRAFLSALAEKKPEAAIEVFDTWTETDPARAILRDNAYGFALMLVGARGRALQELSECYARAPENVVALHNLAAMYRSARLPEFAGQVLEKLLSLYPGNRSARRVLLRILVEADELDRARAIAELTYQLYPNDAESVIDLARIYRVTGEVNLAQSVLKSALNAKPENGPVRIAAARVELVKGLADDALRTLEGKAYETAELTAASEAIRAFALANKGDWAGVTAACEAVSPEMRSLGLHLLFVAARIHEGNPDAAGAALAQAGDIPWARIAGADAVAAALGRSEARPETQEFVNHLKSTPQAFASYAHGVACLADSFPDCALAAFEQAAALIPNASALTALRLEALARALSVDDPAQKAREYAEQAPADPRTWLALAEFYRGKADAEQEAAAIAKALELDADHTDAWLLQARYLERAGDQDGAAAAYARVLTARPGDPVVGNNLAYLILETGGDVQRALELAQAAFEASQGNPTIQPHVLHTLGLAELRANKLDDAEKHLILALQMRPGDPTLLMDYGALLLEKGDTETGERHIRLAIEYANRLGLDFPRKAEAEKMVGAETS